MSRNVNNSVWCQMPQSNIVSMSPCKYLEVWVKAPYGRNGLCPESSNEQLNNWDCTSVDLKILSRLISALPLDFVWVHRPTVCHMSKNLKRRYFPLTQKRRHQRDIFVSATCARRGTTFEMCPALGGGIWATIDGDTAWIPRKVKLGRAPLW